MLKILATLTSSLWIRYCLSKSTMQEVIAMEKIRLSRLFRIQSWCEGHSMSDWEDTSSNVLIMVTRKYWTLSGWRSLQSGLLRNGEGTKIGAIVSRRLFVEWIWRENTITECRRHLELLMRQLMGFQTMLPWVVWTWYLIWRCHFRKVQLDLQHTGKLSSLRSRPIPRENRSRSRGLPKQQVSVRDNSRLVRKETLALLQALKEDHNVKQQDLLREAQSLLIQSRVPLMKPMITANIELTSIASISTRTSINLWLRTQESPL